MRPAYHLARYQARATRAAYRRALPFVVRRRLRPIGEIPVHVVAFSSASDLPEQIASLRSFLRFVGRPLSITVTSDGSHDERERRLLRRVERGVSVMRYDEYARSDLPARVLRYAEVHPMGKKLMVIASLRSFPALYVDSDVLFFPAAGEPSVHAILSARRTMYLQQGWSVGYDRRVLPESEGAAVNAGFLILSEPLDWNAAFARMPAEPTSDDLYLEQTLVHIAMRSAGATPLPAGAWAVHGRDHFRYRDSEDPRETVLRHYVSMTRYKFWLALSRSSMVFGRVKG
jgi:hypothetical protein